MIGDPEVVAEAEEPEVYEVLGTAHAQVGVVQSHTADFADTVLQLDVVELEAVEYVERSGCASDIGFRARATVDVHAADGSLSVWLPALVAVDTDLELLRIAFLETEVDLPEDVQLPETEVTEGASVAGLALEVDHDDGEITLLRVAMAGSCTSRATCSSKSRIPIVTWNCLGPDSDTWFDEVDP